MRTYERGGVVAEGGDLGQTVRCHTRATGVNDPGYKRAYPQRKIWCNALTMPRKRQEFPTDFSVCYFKPGNAWRRALVGPGYAAGIEKQNATTSFVTRDVRVPVQENIDIIRRTIRRDVLQAEF
jgi:hypothetical protein